MRASEFFRSEANGEIKARLTVLYLGYRVEYKLSLRSKRNHVGIVSNISEYNGVVGLWCWCEEEDSAHFIQAEHIISGEKLTVEELLTHSKAEIRALV